MYCNYCGQRIDDSLDVCPYCSRPVNSGIRNEFDKPSFLYALIGFFVPIVGLILYIVKENKQPRKAKSAGKGALAGFIVSIILSVIFTILYFTGIGILYDKLLDKFSVPDISFNEILEQETADDTLEKYVDVSFGEFAVTEDGFFIDTALDVTVKNKDIKLSSYFITIEAVDENGARIDTDTVYADRLNAGQEIYLKAFEFVEEDKIEQFENAEFKVLEIHKTGY